MSDDAAPKIKWVVMKKYGFPIPRSEDIQTCATKDEAVAVRNKYEAETADPFVHFQYEPREA